MSDYRCSPGSTSPVATLLHACKTAKRYQSNATDCQIAGNFVLNIVEAELRPADASDVAKFLTYSNMTLTYMFAIELFVNLFANLFWEFVTDGSVRLAP